MSVPTSEQIEEQVLIDVEILVHVSAYCKEQHSQSQQVSYRMQVVVRGICRNAVQCGDGLIYWHIQCIVMRADEKILKSKNHRDQCRDRDVGSYFALRCKCIKHRAAAGDERPIDGLIVRT
jgi:hypothetical protein